MYENRTNGITALRLWGRVWSPVTDANERQQAWLALQLPDQESATSPTFIATFVTALPQPPIPLLLDAALGLDGATTREAWMRAAQFVGLRSTSHKLPPGHLAPATELLSVCLEDTQDVLATELCQRYLIPWCRRALSILDVEHAMHPVATQYQATIQQALPQLP